MLFEKINELRKSGKLDEALEMAILDLEREPENIWIKRAIAWVYYAYLKKYASKENINRFIDYLNKLKSLDLPADENMVFDKCANQIGKLFFILANDRSIDYISINLIFECIKDFSFTKPSEEYSYLFKAFHKCYKNYSGYIKFADWWDFNNLTPQDFLSREFKGKKIMSIVEQAYIAYSKNLLELINIESKIKRTWSIQEFKSENKIDKIDIGHWGFNSNLFFTTNTGIKGDVLNFTDNPVISLIKDGKSERYIFHSPVHDTKKKVWEFISKLDVIIENHPEYQYPSYFKAKLLLALGDEKNVLSNFLPFAKKKRNDFWVWELLSNIFEAEDKRKLACLCKALSLRTPDEFLVKTRQKLVEILIKEDKFQEAKTEIEKILSVRNDNSWKIPQQLTDWTKQDWYKNTQLQKDNSSFYKRYVKIAEEILFADIPEEIVVVEFVNKNKYILNFIKDKTKHGFFKYLGMIENPCIGDLISVRFKGEGQDGYYKVFSIRKIQDETSCDAISEFNGNLKMREPFKFGFVNDVFIEPQLIVKHELNKDDLINGKAVLSFNKKKNVWGWKAISIN